MLDTVVVETEVNGLLYEVCLTNACAEEML
jgi:hypothetical protein